MPSWQANYARKLNFRCLENVAKQVADRLLCTVGNDVLDALFWTMTEPKKNKLLTLLHFLLAIVYFCKHTSFDFLLSRSLYFSVCYLLSLSLSLSLKVSHSIVILCQTTTLNVAFNSHNKALLTIMMSNNVSCFSSFNYFIVFCLFLNVRLVTFWIFAH